MSDREAYRSVTKGEEEIRFALKWADSLLRQWLSYHDEVALIVSEPRRTLDQNAKIWPMFQDIADQVEWFVDGRLQRLAKEEWKEILTAGLTKHQRVAAGIEGGFVLLGARTSRMTKAQISELIELAYAFGAEHNVVWSEPAKRTYDEHKKRRAA